MSNGRQLAVRWTIGDVSSHGFEALQLSIWGAWRVFGPDAEYAACVNTIPVEQARSQTGDLGDCGAHFVGLNAKRLPWDLNGRPAVECIKDNWLRLRGEIYEKVGLPAPYGKRAAGTDR